MEFLVDDSRRSQNSVPANVTVTVKKLPAVAVQKSGSIRINVPPEKFLSSGGDPDGRETLTKLLRGFFNATTVDVFTLLPALDGEATDIR